jgi:hypothetical protein
MATRWIIMLILLGLVLTAGVAIAQTGYTLPWSTANGGGGSSSGDGYTIQGTVGQTQVNTLTGGGYTLSGGYWIPASETDGTEGSKVYLPTVMR